MGGEGAASGGVRRYRDFILSHVNAQSLSDCQCTATASLKPVIKAAIANCPTSDCGRCDTASGGKSLNVGYEFLSGHTCV